MKQYHSWPYQEFTQHFSRAIVKTVHKAKNFTPRTMTRSETAIRKPTFRNGFAEYSCVFIKPKICDLIIQGHIDFLNQYTFLYYAAPQIGRLCEALEWSRK